MGDEMPFANENANQHQVVDEQAAQQAAEHAAQLAAQQQRYDLIRALRRDVRTLSQMHAKLLPFLRIIGRVNSQRDTFRLLSDFLSNLNNFKLQKLARINELTNEIRQFNYNRQIR